MDYMSTLSDGRIDDCFPKALAPLEREKGKRKKKVDPSQMHVPRWKAQGKGGRQYAVRR